MEYNVGMTFQLWSKRKPEILTELKPDFGLRSWDDLSEDEKHLIWKHLEWHFFNKRESNGVRWENQYIHHEFYGRYTEDKDKKRMRIFDSIISMNIDYKAKNYAPSFLESNTLDSACQDFSDIFMKMGENVVLELLSYYCKSLLEEKTVGGPSKNEDESDHDFAKRTLKWRFEELDNFAKQVNAVFGDFGINVVLTRQGFVPKQDETIMEEIYIPTLRVLSDKKWAKVSEHLSEGFTKYREKDYSTSITSTISAIQALLQIIVNGKIGSGDISKLIPQAMSKNLIPDDPFTQLIFKNMESVFAKQRKMSGVAHPRLENPSEGNARLVLNLAMVFIQHCLQIN